MIVIGEWYNTEIMKKINFFDENTKQWWSPSTGGSNVPAINDLLEFFGMAFGDRVYSGNIDMNDRLLSTTLLSSTSIIRFPKGGTLYSFHLGDETEQILNSKKVQSKVPIIGLYPTEVTNEIEKTYGRIGLFGDSSCLDDANKKSSCFWILEKMLEFTMKNKTASWDQTKGTVLDKNFIAVGDQDLPLYLPKRIDGADLHKWSKVINHNSYCTSVQYSKFNKTDFSPVEWKDNKKQPVNHVDKFREKTFYKPHLESNGSRTYFIPFLVLVVVVGFVVYYKNQRALIKQSPGNTKNFLI